MSAQASSIPNGPPPEPHQESYISIVLNSLASYLYNGVVFLIIVGGLVYLVHFTLLILYAIGKKLVEILHRFEYFNRIFQRMEEKKINKIFKNLPRPIKYQIHEEDATKSIVCAICLDDLKDGELCQVLPLCNHTFHAPCIRPWLVDKHICPNCRSPIIDEKPSHQEQLSAHQ